MRTLTVLLLSIGTVLGAEIKPLPKLGHAELEARLADDVQTVQVYRRGLREVSAYLNAHPEVFPAKAEAAPPVMPREQKEAVWMTWERFLDYMLALESMERYHAEYYRLKGDAKEQSFLIGYAAMIGRYRAALGFIGRADVDPELDKILNEPVPELGLPAGAYAKLKFKYLNVAIATEFAAREVVNHTFTGEAEPVLRQAIQADAQFVWQTGAGRGEMMTAKNALKVLQHGAQTAWFPVQAGVAQWMGHTRVYRAGQSLISPRQLQDLQPKLRPGDILLERREWFLSNIGLPGFWSHAAIYIGTPEERRAFFNEPATRAWVQGQGESSGDLEKLLATRSAAAGAEAAALREDGHPVRVIEAIGEGVSFTSLEHSGACDSLAVLRPRLPAVEKAQTLCRAFHYAGRPYDYNFDFSTDAELVCTELVYKSYEPAAGYKGLTFALTEMLGRKVMPANEVAHQWATQQDTADQQSDLVVFLDGQERARTAVESTAAEFCRTWQRPKWHVLVQ